MGSAALFVAFLVSAYGVFTSLAGALKWRETTVRSAEAASYVSFFLLSAASISLLSAFVRRDFSLRYVYEYCSLSLSDAYAATAFWAGQEGSLLLWAWLLSAFTALTVFLQRRRDRELMPWVNHVLTVNLAFFLILLNFVSDPFAPFPGSPPPDGYGLNPLLQNPGMVIHPPTLFIGYVGLTIPYAFAIAALVTGRTDEGWIFRIRHWTVISWFFLGVGILLGAEWAYVELGWGGYWAWDPVENASLMPWFTATAFMHSIMIQERRGMMKIWNMSLIIISYFLVLFGTFITRSGVISSVHAFGKSNLGTFFLVFMCLTLLIGFALVVWRMGILVPRKRLESATSKEGGFVLNNLILSAMTFAVFWGTIFPVLIELATGKKLAVGPGFFNRMNVPLGICLLLLMGLCPLLGWRRTKSGGLIRNLRFPLGGAAVFAALSWVLGVRNAPSFATFTAAGFVLAVIAQEFYSGSAARAAATGQPLPRALVGLIGAGRRRYGGYIVHAGIALIFIGLSGATMTEEVNATLRPTESLKAGSYTLRYERMQWVPTSDRLSVTTRLRASRDGETLGYLVPERRFYDRKEDQPTTEVSILSSWAEDLYVILTGYNRDGRASFRVLINPFVPWMWAGGYVAALGTLVAVWPRRRRGDRGLPGREGAE